MINYHEQFENEYARLNNLQKKAVDAIYGPVMVIAGPGTGKTQILASRIGNILRSEDAQANADNILCLTYTDNGAVNMRQRLVKMIGPEAYRITISTFHSFCNSVIQGNQSLFGNSNLQSISDLEKVILMRKLIDKFPLNHPLKRYRGEVYYEVKNLQNLFETMEKENWTHEDIELGIAKEIEIIKADEKNYSKRGAKGLKKSVEEEIEKLEKTIPAAKEYANYRKILADENRYTYNDMILWVLKEFKENADLLANNQELYQYILVDEYQDTNGAQNDLLWLLAGEDDNPNIFVVGDDDQAIFRFQGASSKTMLEFQKRFSKFLNQVVLTENYRSTQPILDVSRMLIDHNNDRLSNYIKNLNKHLIAKAETSQETVFQLTEYVNESQQTIAIAKHIKALQENKINLSDIAIIYRGHKEAESIIRYFDAENIPYNVKRNFNILQDVFIEKIITILKYISIESKRPHSAEHLLFEIMHYDFFEIQSLDIARISIDIREQKRTEKNIFWREIISKISTDSNSKKAIHTLSQDIEFWITNVFNLTLQQLVEKIIIRSGILSYIMLQQEKHWYMEMLNSFFQFLKDECEKTTSLNIHEFTASLELMDEVEVSLPLNRITNHSNGVNLTTAHGSKGEEFKYVFIINANQKIWGKSSRRSGFVIPQNLFSDVETFDPINDERRLFYVAMTRAKTNLNISYVSNGMDGKDQEKSIFIAEIEASTGLQVVKEKVSEEDVIHFQSIILADEEVPQITLFDHSYIDYLLQGYQMSVTHLNNYLKCPVKFYFNNILHVPMAKNESMEFGSAMHDVLQRIYFPSLSNPGEILTLENAYIQLDNYLIRHRESFTDEQFKRRSEFGKVLLNNIYPNYIEQSYKNVKLEKRFTNIPVEGIPLNGNLDKIEYYDTDVNIVDYKTGAYHKEKFARPHEKDSGKETYESKNGGDYWRQGVFYSLLIDNYKLEKMRFQSAEFVFIEHDKKTKENIREKIFVTDEDQEIVKNQIKTSWEKIHKHEFETGCNEDNCEWCNFLKKTRKREKSPSMNLEDNQN